MHPSIFGWNFRKVTLPFTFQLEFPKYSVKWQAPLEYPEKNLSEQSREPTINSTHISRECSHLAMSLLPRGEVDKYYQYQSTLTKTMSGQHVVSLCDVILRQCSTIQGPVHWVILSSLQLTKQGCMAIHCTLFRLSHGCIDLSKVIKGMGECCTKLPFSLKI